MKSKTTFKIALISLHTLLLFVAMSSTSVSAAGPSAANWREYLVTQPDAQLLAMRNHDIDILTNLIRTSDIEQLVNLGFTVTDAAGFHMGHVGFNLRKPVLNDVNFRRALFHGYAQDQIIAQIYQYTVTPVQSLVPPAQGGWVNPDVPQYPFNPGDASDPPGTPSVFGVLKGAGYTYHGSGYGDLSAYWTDPSDNPLPTMYLWTPTSETAPTSHDHGARIVEEWNRCGLNNIIHQPRDFNAYTTDVFTNHDFDMYMIFWSLNRFPDHLYDMTHSSQDIPDGYNPVGIHDPVLDELTEIVKFGLDQREQVEAAYAAQAWLYNASNPWAFPYMQMYSRIYFNAFDPDLGGIINSPGFGSDPWENLPWTLMNMEWTTPDGLRPRTGDDRIIFCLNLEPDSMNPTWASTVYEWNIIDMVLDELITINPYTHEDLPWIASGWKLEGPLNMTITLDSEDRFHDVTAGSQVNITNGMKVTFNLRTDVYWQDGNLYTPDDAEFALEFMRNNQIPRYRAGWENIADVQVINSTAFEVYSYVTSRFNLYDFAEIAPMLPPQVWSWLDGADQQTILGYTVWLNTTNTGPVSTPTQLFGTGPYVFGGYDTTGGVADFSRNDNYFVDTTDVGSMVVEMFHKIGDTNSDGDMDATDLSAMSLSFGKRLGQAGYNPLADVNEDGIVDATDVTLLSFYWGVPREYGS